MKVADPPVVTLPPKLTWQLVHAEPSAWVYSIPSVNPSSHPLVRHAGAGWAPEGAPAAHDEPVKHSALHYAEYIGRVGVLAAALGVGAAVAGTPGIAWAEPTEHDTTASSSATESASSEATSEPEPAPVAVAQSEAAPSQDDTETAKEAETEAEAPPETESTPDEAEAATAETPTEETPIGETRPEQTPPVVEATTERAVTPDIPADEVAEAPATEVPAAEAPAEPATTPIAEPRSDTPTPTPTGDPNEPTAPNPTTPVMQTPAPLPEQTITSDTQTPTLTPTETTTTDADVVSPAAAPETPASLATVNYVLDTVLAPLTTPATPAAQAAQTSLLWGVFAWVRRTFFNSHPTLSYDPTTTSQTDTTTDRGTHRHGLRGLLNIISVRLFGPGHTGDTLDIAATNTAPIPATPAYTLSTTQPSTGTVPGELHITDPDLDTLTYTVTGGPANGAISLDAATGAFSYTPTPTARHHAAAQDATPDRLTDEFSVTVDDGHGGLLTVPVTVTIDPTNTPPTMTLIASDPDSAGTVHLTVAVTDPDTDPITYLVIHDPTYGTLTPTLDGYDYTPTEEARHAAATTPGITTESIQFRASDAHNGIDNETATVTIAPASIAPGVETATRGLADSSTGVVNRSDITTNDSAELTVETAGTHTATMAGTFGIEPKYETITAPGGGTLAGQELRFNTLPAQSGINSAYRAVGVWLESLKGTLLTPGEVPILVSYSMSTHAVVGRLRTDPESLRGINIIMLGAPETPGNPDDGNGYQNTEGLPTTGDLSNVTMAVVQYDPVADAAVQPNYWSRLNARMATHRTGYNGLDLNSPDVIRIDPVSGATVLYFRSDVLPMLKWLDPWVSDEKMAELDAKYRPLVEEAYHRPDGIFSPEWEAASADLATADV